MTVFLKPSGEPFYGGTYFPPEDRGQMPGFPRLLRAMDEVYRTRRSDIDNASAQLVDRLRQTSRMKSQSDLLHKDSSKKPTYIYLLDSMGRTVALAERPSFLSL